MPRSLRFAIALVCIALLALLPASLAAYDGSRGAVPYADHGSPQQGGPEAALAAQVRAASDGDVRISYHARTGKARFVGAGPGHPILLPHENGHTGVPAAPSQPGAGRDQPEVAARAYLQAYGALFGLRDQARELARTRLRSTADGRTVLRFQQTLDGIPVFGGEMIVHLDARMRLLVALGEILPWEAPRGAPQIAPETAVSRAKEAVAKYSGVAPEALDATAPELWVYNPVLIGAPGPPDTRLVWRFEVRAADPPVRDLVLVDAASGALALRFSLLTTGLSQYVYDNQNTRGLGLPGAYLVGTEVHPPMAPLDAVLAFQYAADTYAFFAELGRDSIDGAGMPLVSTVRYCPPTGDCPYPNAFWNGKQMVYGEGMVADDVVAHEMTHGIIEHEAGLFYYMQSGAINEGLADAFGEFVDLSNASGNDSASVGWLIGEDLPPGRLAVPLRNMRDPSALLHADRMTSPYYACGPEDYGGVHTNGGVLNKAVYLITDGGAFNGQSVTGMGIPKASRILYEALTNLLTSAADYNDLADALVQAALNLTGQHDITPSDVEQVRRAVAATEMHLQPAACPATEAPVCDSGAVYPIFADDLENPSSANWQTGFHVGDSHWYYPQTENPYPGWDMTYATSGHLNFWGDADFRGYWYGFAQSNGVSDSYIVMTRDVPVPSGAYLRFNHAYAFEAAGGNYYDGGVVEYSIDRGQTWQDAGQLFTHNGYNGTLLPESSAGNPLGGRRAFVGESNGYISSRLSLQPLAGQSVRFRFRLGTDELAGYYGWYVDDISIYTCGAPAQPTVPPPSHTVSLPLINHFYRVGTAQVIAHEGFEGALSAGWQVADYAAGYGEYKWAARTCRPWSGERSGWAVGGGSDGATLPCMATYPDNANSWLVYGPFSLADATAAGVDLVLWCNTEPGDDSTPGDHLSVMASVNGLDFRGTMFSGRSDGWMEFQLDLADVYELGDLCGEPAVWFAVIFDSDAHGALPEGAYVDDITIWKAKGSPITYPATAGRAQAAASAGPVDVHDGLRITAGARTLPAGEGR